MLLYLTFIWGTGVSLRYAIYIYIYIYIPGQPEQKVGWSLRPYNVYLSVDMNTIKHQGFEHLTEDPGV